MFLMLGLQTSQEQIIPLIYKDYKVLLFSIHHPMVILLILLHLEMGEMVMVDPPIHLILPMAHQTQTLPLHLLHMMEVVEEVVVAAAAVVALPIHLMVEFLTILLLHHMVAMFLHKEVLQQTPEQLPKS